MNHEPNIYGTDGDTRKGAAVYTPLALALYDLAVLRISNSFVWQCASHVLLDFYNQHISDKHLDIGVGTGLHACWLKAGLTPCGSYIRTDRSGHSGITNLNGGRRTKACDSIAFCFRRICRSGSWTAVLIDGHAGRKTRATMLQHGSCSISRRLSSFSVRCVSRSALPVPLVS